MITDFIQLPVIVHAYSFFYSLAFLAVFIILLLEGRRRNFPILPWILIIVFVRVLFILGTKLTAFSWAEWQSMISSHLLLPGTKKLLPGGLLFGIVALFIGKRWMGFRQSTLDAFAIAVPFGLAIQRLGCFFYGCCYGKPCELPWGIEYPVNTLAHFHQFQDGLISTDSVVSLPVHPVQVYETVGLLCVVLLVYLFRTRWKRSGNSALFSLSLILLVRFLVEFLRAPEAHTNGGTMIGPLNQVQWSILILLPVLSGIIAFQELRPRNNENQAGTIRMPSIPGMLLFFITSSALIWLFSNWFQFIEILAMLIVFVPAALLILIQIFRQRTRLSSQLIYASLLILPFFLMSQSFPEIKNDSVLIRRSHSIGIGVASGNYSNQVTNVTGEGCDQVANTNYFNQKYLLGGASYNIRTEYLEKNRETNFGVNLFAGRHTEYIQSIAGEQKTQIFGLNPYFKFDSRWIGLGGGMHLGNLTYSIENQDQSGSYLPESGNVTANFYPQVYARLGPRDILFADYHLADHFPSALPGFRQQLGFGTGFGLSNGTNFRVGSTFLGTYFSANLPFKNKVILEPLVIFNKKDESGGQLQSSDNIQFSISARYVLGQKTKKVKPSFK